ncbi:MAG: hypothetical protein ACYCT0_11415, partial [Sulfobacillus sp.]
MGQEKEAKETKENKAVPVRPHPKPEWGPVNGLNDTIRRELWYVDTMVSSPFRAIRRTVEERPSAWSQGADEFLW